jgi:hypothetical protein
MKKPILIFCIEQVFGINHCSSETTCEKSLVNELMLFVYKYQIMEQSGIYFTSKKCQSINEFNNYRISLGMIEK